MQSRTLGNVLTRSKHVVLHGSMDKNSRSIALHTSEMLVAFTSFVKDVPHAKMQDINLTSARKLKVDLDKTIDSLSGNREVQVTFFTSSRRELTVEVPTETEMDIFCKSLDRSKIKPVALSLIKPYSDQFVSESSSILTIPDVFVNNNLNLPYTDLLKCFDVEISLSSEDISQIEIHKARQMGLHFFYIEWVVLVHR